ncbi:MAG TPA: LysR family transcriptional regulator [Candidatus Merdenecus merdavium]|nr:LysR family transcriptional regulator [Candidatus Merdenecus merdavium]
MLDYRIDTFVAVSKSLNYTKAAEELGLTQPAVSQHIRYLESYYGVKLFFTHGKQIRLTPEGKEILKLCLAVRHDIKKMKQKFHEPNAHKNLRFGVSLTIGEYLMGDILKEYVKIYPKDCINMIVENTNFLFQKIDNGKIDFAFIEGAFNKKQYKHHIVKKEPLILVCAPEHPLAHKEIYMDELYQENLIVREGAARRQDQPIEDLNMYSPNISNFNHVQEIGNLTVMKDLVQANYGISFLYELSVKEELSSGKLKRIEVKDFKEEREFNFVYLKHARMEEEYLEFYHSCKEILEQEKKLLQN